jgi:uncharacterized membrane protein
MLFVCLAHFADVFFNGVSPLTELLSDLSHKIGKVGTPTFVILSGLVLGYLFKSKREQFEASHLHLIDRALALLITGHILIVACIVTKLGLSMGMRVALVTDMIALCVILGSLVIKVTPSYSRIILGLAIYATSWIAEVVWNPDQRLLLTVKAIIVGDVPLSKSGTGSAFPFPIFFPILPWFAVYILSSCLGERIAALHHNGMKQTTHRSLFKIGGLMLGFGLTLKMIQTLFFHFHILETESIVSTLMYPSQKFPPGVCYILVYGGTGLLLTAFFFWIEGAGLLRRVSEAMRTVGRASMGVFAAQFFIYYTVFSLLVSHTNLAPLYMWPVYWLVSLYLLFKFAQFWNRAGLQSFLSVGYPFLRQPISVYSASQPEPQPNGNGIRGTTPRSHGPQPKMAHKDYVD